MTNHTHFKLIHSPISSEKANRLLGENVYVFKVLSSANKYQIKDAIETIFNTKVASVRVLNVKAKEKVFRGRVGLRKEWRKAYITLQQGHKIENFLS